MKANDICVIAVLVAMAASSCGTCKPATHAHNYTDIHVIDEVVIRDSIVFVELPSESASAILPEYKPSHLETSLAVSDAFVDSLGLHHSLENKKTPTQVHVPVTEHNIVKDSIDVQEVVKEVEVEKPLTWWQRTRIGAFWWLLGGLVLSLGWIFKKPLLSIITKLIKL